MKPNPSSAEGGEHREGPALSRAALFARGAALAGAAGFVGHHVARPQLASGDPLLSGAGYLNVAAYGAVGNGVADDTTAIQNALNAAGNANLGPTVPQGGMVFLPAGRYRVSGTLTIPAHVSLVGVGVGPDTLDVGSVLISTANAGNGSGTPFITLGGFAASIGNVRIIYPNQVNNGAPTAYPWTIRGTTGNHVIRNILLMNSYQGIDLKTFSCGRHIVENVHGQILYRGIWVDKCLDVGRINGIHFWPFWTSLMAGAGANLETWVQQNAIALLLQKTDWQIVNDFFCFGYAVAVELGASDRDAAPNAQFTNLNADQCREGIRLQGTQTYGVHVNGFNYAGQSGFAFPRGIWAYPNRASQLFVTAATFWNTFQAVRWDGPAPSNLSLQGSMIREHTDPVAITLAQGQASIQNNYFYAHGFGGSPVAVDVAAACGRTIVSGNQLNSHALQPAASGPNRLITGNL